MTRNIPSSRGPQPSRLVGAAVRGCLLVLLLWAALTAVYLLVLSRWLEGDDLLAAPILSLLGLWLGFAIWTSATGTAESRAVRQALRGEAPRDGKRFAAIGVVVPVAEELEAPLTGRRCVAYEYEIFTLVREGVDDDLVRRRDYSGFRRVPFFLRTAHGDHAVLGFGNLEEIPEEVIPADRALAVGGARAWVARTEFTPFDGRASVGSALAVAGSLAAAESARVDSRSKDPALEPGRTFTERALPCGVEASAVGTYSIERGGLVSSFADPVMIRLGSAVEVDHALASQRRGQLWVAAILFVLSHGGYALYLYFTLR